MITDGQWGNHGGTCACRRIRGFKVDVLADNRGQYASNQRPPEIGADAIAEIAEAAVAGVEKLWAKLVAGEIFSQACFSIQLPHGARLTNSTKWRQKYCAIVV